MPTRSSARKSERKSGKKLRKSVKRSRKSGRKSVRFSGHMEVCSEKYGSEIVKMRRQTRDKPYPYDAYFLQLEYNKCKRGEPSVLDP
jgi:hypothetical protein